MTPEEFFGAVSNMPDPLPVFYRLYHDEQGYPLFYSMEDLPGTYLEIDKKTFSRSATNVRVRNGKLVEVTGQITHKLVPSDQGTQCHTTDVAVVVTHNGTYWSKQVYEQS